MRALKPISAQALSVAKAFNFTLCHLAVPGQAAAHVLPNSACISYLLAVHLLQRYVLLRAERLCPAFAVCEPSSVLKSWSCHSLCLCLKPLCLVCHAPAQHELKPITARFKAKDTLLTEETLCSTAFMTRVDACCRCTHAAGF